MLRRIILENFMSHGRTEIDLADGLTVLTGPNNCGKSAVVAALQILASNGRSTHVMRHGEKVCRITVETADGHTICWERKKTTVKYTIDGEDIHRVGQSVPESLHQVLRLNKVEAKVGKATQEYDIHFGEQKSPVFLLGESGSRAASFFASSSDASRLVEMQHRHRSRLTAKRSESKRLNKELQKNGERLACFDPVDQLAERIDAAEALVQKIDKRQLQADKLRTVARQLAQQQAETAKLQQQHGILGRLERTTTTPASLEQAKRRQDRLTTSIASLHQLNDQKTLHTASCTALAPLSNVPSQHDTRHVQSLIQALHASCDRKKSAATVLTHCRQLTAPPTLEPVSLCDRHIRQLERLRQVCREFEADCSVLASLQPVPATSDTTGLKKLICSLMLAIQKSRQTGRISSALRSLHEAPVPQPRARLQQLLERLDQSHQKVCELVAEGVSLQRLRPPVTITDLSPVATAVKQLTNSHQAVAAALAESEDCRQRCSRCEADIRRFVQDNPTCAVCGSEIDPDTIMVGAPGIHRHMTTEADGENLRFRRKG